MTATLDDRVEIEQVAARLVKVFPEVPEPSVRDVVATAWSHFDAARSATSCPCSPNATPRRNYAPERADRS